MDFVKAHETKRVPTTLWGGEVINAHTQYSASIVA